MQKVLSLDYGGVRIGAAISVGGYAEPLNFLKNGPRLFIQLEELVKGEGVSEILLGLPEEPARGPVLDFKNNLEETLGLPVILWDEVLTTRIAEESLRGKTRKKKKSSLDSAAAAIILQEYLDSNK